MPDLLSKLTLPSTAEMPKKGGTMRSMALSKCISAHSLPDGQDQCILEGWGSPQMGLLDPLYPHPQATLHRP